MKQKTVHNDNILNIQPPTVFGWLTVSWAMTVEQWCERPHGHNMKALSTLTHHLRSTQKPRESLQRWFSHRDKIYTSDKFCKLSFHIVTFTWVWACFRFLVIVFSSKNTTWLWSSVQFFYFLCDRHVQVFLAKCCYNMNLWSKQPGSVLGS